MVSIVRRCFSGFLAVFFSLSSLLVPVTASAATYNTVQNKNGLFVVTTRPSLGSLVEVSAAAASALGKASPWVAGITVGVEIVRAVLKDSSGNNAIQVQTRGQAAMNNGQVWTNTSASPQVSATWWGCGAFDTTAAAVGSACAAASSPQPCVVQQTDETTGYWLISCSGQPYSGTAGRYCPSGYAVSGSLCNLTDVNQANTPPKDGIATVSPNSAGNGLERKATDTDPLPASPTPSEIQNPTKNYGTDQYGNPTSTSISPQADGGYKIDQRVQTTNNNQTSTTINNITVNNAGTVINVTSTTVPGSLETADPSATPISGSGPAIQFPDDYNRESTQQQIKQKLDDLLNAPTAEAAPDYAVEQKKTDLNQETTDKAEAIPGEYMDDKSKWFSWVWTPPVGSCSPIGAGTIHGQAFGGWNICPYVDKIRDVIGYLLAVLSAWAVYAQMFKREE